ncbi:hypothetical protein SEVIR_2G150350v4 [Setaria viridis]
MLHYSKILLRLQQISKKDEQLKILNNGKCTDCGILHMQDLISEQQVHRLWDLGDMVTHLAHLSVMQVWNIFISKRLGFQMVETSYHKWSLEQVSKLTSTIIYFFFGCLHDILCNWGRLVTCHLFLKGQSYLWKTELVVIMKVGWLDSEATMHFHCLVEMWNCSVTLSGATQLKHVAAICLRSEASICKEAQLQLKAVRLLSLSDQAFLFDFMNNTVALQGTVVQVF